jgi:tetratricopeptide (TPR) repeat protein
MEKTGSRVSIFLNLIVLLLIISGCSTIRVPIKVTHPAEINMAQYKQIAISDIRGNMGQAFADELKNRLIESNHFKVVDRSSMNQIMKELKLSQSDLADSANAVKLGKLMSASALIAGHTEGKYKEKRSSSRETCYRDKQKYACTYYYRKGRYSTSGSIDVIDVQTGEIIRSKVLNAAYQDSTSAVDDTPPAIDKDSLISAALSKNLNTFMKAITPWDEVVQVPFVKDGDIPELERGINQAKLGELQEAVRIFAGAAKSAESNSKIKPDTIAKAYWDLGLAHEYLFDYDNAIVAFKKAYVLNPEDDYIREIRNAKKLKIERKKLEDQNK